MIMEELLKHDEQTDVSDYQFADGDLSNFQEEFSIPKQDMGIEEEPDGDEWKDESDNDEPAPPSALVAKQTARFITGIIDHGAAFGLSMYSKNSIEDHKADKASKNEIEKIIYAYTKETGGNIPLLAQLAIVLITTYGLQIPQAARDRKMNLEREKLEEERRELELQKAEFEAQKKISKLQNTAVENGSESH